MKKRVIVISVPFQRLIRNLLGKPVLETIYSKVDADIIILSPFSNDQAFQNEFRHDRTHFVTWVAPVELKQPNGFFFTIMELLRVNGFWRRNRNHGMKAYLVNNKMRFGFEGNDVYFSLPKRIFFTFLSWIGTNQKAWHFFLSIIPKAHFESKELDDVINRYERVTVIQSANWGLQDHMLAWKARKKNWEKIMIPYTVDQLFANGYLLSNYDVVCVQGTNEFEYVKTIHNYPDSKVCRLGSAWFTNMSYLKEKYKARLESSKTSIKKKKQILYTGCSSQFFPSISEYQGLDYLLEAVTSGQLKDVSVIYRPLGESEERKNQIVEKYGKVENLIIQFAQKACFGLAEFDSVSQEIQLVDHIEQLSNADLVIMCFATSIAQDAAFLGIPSVINMVDNTGIVKRRGVHDQINEEGFVRLFEGLPVFHNYDELILAVNQFLDNPIEAQSQARHTVSLWHYPEVNFVKKLAEVLN